MKLFKSGWLSTAFILLICMLIPCTILADDKKTKSYVLKDTVRVFAEKYLKIPVVSAIATKISAPLIQTPISIGIVSRALFEVQDGSIMSDALKNVSGVNIQNNFGVHEFFLIRGFESLSSGLVLTDGATEPEASFYNLYNIAQVEVLKGPGAFLYGGNSLSGTVNLVRKQPIFNKFANLNVSYGAFNTVRSTFDAGISDLNSKLAFRLNGLWQDSNNYRDNTDNKSFAINPALTWLVNANSSLTVNLEYVNSSNKPDSGIPLLMIPNETFTEFTPDYPDVDRKFSYQTPFDKSDQDLMRFRLDYQHEFSPSVTLRNKFYFTRLAWNSIGTITKGAFPTTQGGFNVNLVHRAVPHLDDEQIFAGNQIEALISFSTGSIKHKLLTGIELARLGDEFTLKVNEQVSPLDLQSPEESETLKNIDQLNLVLRDSADARSLAFAPYFINQATISNKMHFFIGARFDLIDYQNEGITKYNTEVKFNKNYSQFSPMGGIAVTPVENWSLYANAGKAFALPSAFVSVEPVPEKSTQYEVGTKALLFNGKLSTSMAYYHLQKYNINIQAQIASPPGKGDQRSKGVEFELSTELIKNWHTFVNYAYTDGKLTKFYEEKFNIDGSAYWTDRAGNTPAFVPKHILNIWTNKQFQSGIGFGLGLRYMSEQFIAINNEFQIDEVLIFDASLFYTFKNLRWSLNAKNLTNKKYLTGSGFYSNSVIPANPFAVYSSIDFSL